MPYGTCRWWNLFPSNLIQSHLAKKELIFKFHFNNLCAESQNQTSINSKTFTNYSKKKRISLRCPGSPLGLLKKRRKKNRETDHYHPCKKSYISCRSSLGTVISLRTKVFDYAYFIVIMVHFSFSSHLIFEGLQVFFRNHHEFLFAINF